MCISCPHLVLTAAAGWLLMHPESRMGTWEQTNPKRTSNSKDICQWRDRHSLVPYVSVPSARSLQPTNNSPPSPQLCSYLFIPHWYMPLAPSKHQLPPVSIILLRCPPSATCVSLCQRRDPLALRPGGLSSTGMPTATTPRGTRCSLRLAAFSQNCLGSP